MNARLNNFDLIRLLAALQVVFVHAVGHTQLLETGPGWLLALLDGVILFPGVAVFFVISGFLIAGSWERSRDRPLAYFRRRGLRIYPALLVCVGVSVVILGIRLHRHFDRVKGWLEGKVWIHLTAYAGFAALRTYGVGREGPMAWLFYAGYLPERVLLALLTVSAAYSHRGLSSRLLNGADISYGVYIYHFLLINLLIELGGMGSPGWVVLVFVLAIAAGLASWFGIERRALSLKSLVPGRASPVASPIDRPARDW